MYHGLQKRGGAWRDADRLESAHLHAGRPRQASGQLLVDPLVRHLVNDDLVRHLLELVEADLHAVVHEVGGRMPALGKGRVEGLSLIHI